MPGRSGCVRDAIGLIGVAVAVCSDCTSAKSAAKGSGDSLKSSNTSTKMTMNVQGPCHLHL